MPANLQRLLPILLVIFLLLFVLPAILKHHSSSNHLTSKELSQETIATTTKVDALQRKFRTAHKGYTDSVADLLALGILLCLVALRRAPDQPAGEEHDRPAEDGGDQEDPAEGGEPEHADSSVTRSSSLSSW